MKIELNVVEYDRVYHLRYKVTTYEHKNGIFTVLASRISCHEMCISVAVIGEILDSVNVASYSHRLRNLVTNCSEWHSNYVLPSRLLQTLL